MKNLLRSWRRRFMVPIIAALTAVGALSVGMPAANAADGVWYNIPKPFSGQCSYSAIWYSSASYPGSSDVKVGLTQAEINNGQVCGAYFQFEFLCGVYGLPSTYYWNHSQSIQFQTPYGGPPYYADYGGDPCPYWGNDIVLNFGIVVWAWTNYYVCWNQNAGNWVYLRSDIRCTFN